MAELEPIYRVIFTQHGSVYEIYAQYISEDHLMGFIELENLIFSDTKSSVVVDPSEEKLRSEFKDVKRCYIPMHTISRIDEVIKKGPARIKVLDSKDNNITHFPPSYFDRPRDTD